MVKPTIHTEDFDGNIHSVLGAATRALRSNGQSRKRAMNRSILRNGWGSFVNKLSYKAEWYGRTLIQVDRFYPSSKLCHDCGYKYKELRLSEREWTCKQCGPRMTGTSTPLATSSVKHCA